jgi:hypothetical protein
MQNNKINFSPKDDLVRTAQIILDGLLPTDFLGKISIKIESYSDEKITSLLLSLKDHNDVLETEIRESLISDIPEFWYFAGIVRIKDEIILSLRRAFNIDEQSAAEQRSLNDSQRESFRLLFNAQENHALKMELLAQNQNFLAAVEALLLGRAKKIELSKFYNCCRVHASRRKTNYLHWLAVLLFLCHSLKQYEPRENILLYLGKPVKNLGHSLYLWAETMICILFFKRYCVAEYKVRNLRFEALTLKEQSVIFVEHLHEKNALPLSIVRNIRSFL